ncbi:HisA/HisF-related TIM barrel protein [Candidatus Vidania fulgoroideorum]
MKLIPAIDIYKKKCVRLIQGNFKKKLYIAKHHLLNKITTNNYNRIHIIDLEGAKTGKVKNLHSVIKLTRQIRQLNPKTQIQTGGGIRSITHIQRLIHEKIDVILSTVILQGQQLPSLKKYIKHIILSIDYKYNKVFIKGWQQEYNQLTHLIHAINQTQLSKIIFTDITRDGTQQGLNKNNILTITHQICKKKKLMFAGGLHHASEFKKLATTLKSPQIYGIIGGRFLF